MKHILIVDDHPEVRELVEVTFSLGGYDVHKAVNGGAALDYLRRNPADLVILDVMMPGGMDGYEVCRRIKKDPDMANCKVVMLSARGQESDRQKGLESGADEYVVKPFSPAELLARVEGMLAE